MCPYNQKNAILFVEIYRKDDVFFMNLSIQDEFHLFAEELQRYLSPHVLQQLAQDTGFVKRKSKYGARDLAAFFIWISQHVASDSLT